MNAVGQTLDRHQVHTLLKTSLKLDWRGSTNPFTGHSVKKSKIPGMAIIVMLNLGMSIFLGLVFLKVVDLLTGLTISGGVAMLIVGIQVLLEFGNIIISPDDYNVISPHPVNSKTFYVAKLIHLLIYVSLLSVTVSVGPAVFAAFRFDSLWIAPVVLIHFWISCVFISALVMVLYTIVLKSVDRRRLERSLGYLHMVAILSMYLGLSIVPRIVKRYVFDVDVRTLPWLKVMPSYWFGSAVNLFSNGGNLESLGFLLLGLILLFGLGRMAISYLSLSYAESLVKTSRLQIVQKPSRIPRFVRKWWSRHSRPEDRALLLLVRANFNHDIHFRIGVLGYLPLMLFYLLYGLVIAGSNVRDPLAPQPDTQVVSNLLFGIVAVIAPFMMIGVMHTSKAWQAGWVFYTTPIDRLYMVLAAGRLATGLLIPPLTLLLCAVYTYLYGNFLHAVMHTGAMVTLALTGLTLLSLYNIHLPFTQEYVPGKMTSGALRSLIVSMIVFGIPIGIIGSLGYGGYWGWLIFVVCALVINSVLALGRDLRIRRVARTWEFTG